MATTNYAKADAVMTKVVSDYTQMQGFRGAKVVANRAFGTYSIRVYVESGTKHEIPKSIDRIEIEVSQLKKRPIR